jgi:hypothetical protein
MKRKRKGGGHDRRTDGAVLPSVGPHVRHKTIPNSAIRRRETATVNCRLSSATLSNTFHWWIFMYRVCVFADDDKGKRISRRKFGGPNTWEGWREGQHTSKFHRVSLIHFSSSCQTDRRTRCVELSGILLTSHSSQLLKFLMVAQPREKCRTQCNSMFVISNFRDWFRQIVMNPVPDSSVVAQNTLSSVLAASVV